MTQKHIYYFMENLINILVFRFFPIYYKDIFTLNILILGRGECRMSFESDLIATKYCRPGVCPQLLTRKRLSEKLDASLTYRLTFVSAPAGYGKTTAVLDWLETRSLTSAWLSIDEGDSDPVRFWRYFLAALNQEFQSESACFTDIPVSRELVTSNILAGLLINRLSCIPGRIILILDDYHLIKNTDSYKSFAYFIKNAPANFSTVLLSRGELDTDLESLYVKGQILKLNAHDLSFRREEISDFFEVTGCGLTQENLSKIELETEGWAAGLVAAALTIQEGNDCFFKSGELFSSSRHIGSFLKEQVFEQWPDEVKSFLTKTSVLDRFCLSLSHKVTGLENCGEIINSLLAHNCFIIPLDQEYEWFRYHHLFSDFLKSELSAGNPSVKESVLKKAGLWYEDNGFLKEAMDAYIAGGNYPGAFTLYKKTYRHFCRAGEHALLFGWMSRMPEEVYRDNVTFRIVYAWFLLLKNQVTEAEAWADKADACYRRIKDGTETGYANQLLALICFLQANIATTRMDARKAACCYEEACGIRLRENLFLGEINSGQPGILRTCYGFLGRLNKVDEAYSGVRETVSGVIGDFSAYFPMIFIESFYERNQLDECRETMAKTFEEILALGTSGIIVPCFITLAKIRRADGDIEGAFAVVEEGRKKLPDEGKMRWNYILDLFAANLYIGAGDRPGAEAWMKSSRTGVYDTLSAAREFEHIVFSRYLMLAGRLEEAVLLLNRLNSFTKKEQRLGSQIEVLCLLAEAYLLKKDTEKAVDTLDAALELGMEDGYARTFLDEPEPMAHLLRLSLKQKAAGTGNKKYAYAENLLRCFKKPALPRKDSAKISEALTHTEKIVLQLLAAKCTNAEIAKELKISIRTVKYHNSNIFSKLGVKNRVEAIYKIKDSKF